MIRTFQPIGQGAFYIEQFDGFTIVYDCGSNENESLIKKEIRSIFEKGQEIDAVFISHLHSDHVNGLEFLIEYCNVKRIFMPLLSENDKIQLLIQNAIIQTRSSLFLENLIETQSIENSSVVLVPETEIDSEINLDQEPIQIDGSINSETLKNNPKLHNRNINNWVFIPFNFRQMQRINDLKTKLSKENIFFDNISEFKNQWKQNKQREKIIDIFKSISGSMNANSMVLYSGPDKNEKSHYNHIINSLNFNPFHRCHYLAACMYFGDYEAKGNQKWTQFLAHYKKYWDYVGTVQIPHHGSKYNYNQNINRGKPKISIISAGINNIHRHPHASTLKDIILDNGIPIIVSENVGSRIMVQIHGV